MFLLSMDEGNGTLGLRQRGSLCVKHSKKTITGTLAINVMSPVAAARNRWFPVKKRLLFERGA